MYMKMPPDVKRYFAKISKLGGEARKKKLTPARRREIAKNAAAVRWGKRKKAKQ